jgi:hypothetical protein
MLIEQKKKTIVDKMYSLKGKARNDFAKFLVTDFTDEELKDLTHENADKLLRFLESI